jgi:hypothetical protein
MEPGQPVFRGQNECFFVCFQQVAHDAHDAQNMGAKIIQCFRYFAHDAHDAHVF